MNVVINKKINFNMEKKIKTLIIGIIIVVALSFLNMCNSCSVRRSQINEAQKTDSLVIEFENKINDIYKYIDKLPNNNDLKIEGLRNELRMIQATDRRMLDVRRQTEIEEEIKKLTENE